MPTSDDLQGYDAYIYDSGDYAWDDADNDVVFAFYALGLPIMFIGEQVLPPGNMLLPPEPLYDLTVDDGAHPLARGFAEGDTITLGTSYSDQPAVVLSPEDLSEGMHVIFSRGANSPQPGSAVVLTYEDTGLRMVIAFFAFYRLPLDAQSAFALNAVSWLTGQ
jgi:hypothetical protein